MKKVEVTEAALQRNVAWIEAVEKAMDELADPLLTRKIMKAAGQKCAAQILDDCAEILGKKPETVDELLYATNKRRLQRYNMANLWERCGNQAHLRIDECACTLVKAGLAKPGPVHCLCTLGLMESLFQSVSRGPVTLEAVKTFGFGDDCCEFWISFSE